MYETYEQQAQREMYDAAAAQDRATTAPTIPDGWRAMPSRFAGKCATCGERFRAGTPILYSRTAPKGANVVHATCGVPVPPERTKEDRMKAVQDAFGALLAAAVVYKKAHGMDDDIRRNLAMQGAALAELAKIEDDTKEDN